MNLISPSFPVSEALARADALDPAQRVALAILIVTSINDPSCARHLMRLGDTARQIGLDLERLQLARDA